MKTCNEYAKRTLTRKEFFKSIEKEDRSFLIKILGVLHKNNLGVSAVAEVFPQKGWKGGIDPNGLRSNFEPNRDYTYDGKSLNLEVSGDFDAFLKTIEDLKEHGINYTPREISSIGVYDVVERETDPLKGDALDFYNDNRSFFVSIHLKEKAFSEGRKIKLF